MSENTTALVVQPESPLPAFSGQQMAAAFEAYQQLQSVLDKAMPDQIMSIRGRPFRKKGYWRAVRTAFNLSVECTKEERRVTETFDWGHAVTYRAMAPNGRWADGDGACFASEKAEAQRTEHNVRAHAHTRAFNRAVSNLVGFGEVSAEEMGHEPEPEHPTAATPTEPPAPRATKPSIGGFISDKQRSRFWAVLYSRAKALGLEKKQFSDAVHAWMKKELGIESSEQIPVDQYDRVIAAIEDWEKVPF